MDTKFSEVVCPTDVGLASGSITLDSVPLSERSQALERAKRKFLSKSGDCLDGVHQARPHKLSRVKVRQNLSPACPGGPRAVAETIPSGTYPAGWLAVAHRPALLI